jgi:Protein of unknown function (DUF3592)
MVVGQTFEGRSIGIGGDVRGSRTVAERLASTYPVGAALTVYFDPKAPGRAYLDRTHRGIGLEIGRGLLALIAGATVLLFS